MLKQTAAVVILLATGNSVEAQFNAGAGAQRIQRPLNRPTVSPYLNLLRGGNGTGLNYYGLVRPELQFGQSLQQLQFGLGDLRRRGGAVNPFGGFGGASGVTGHSVVFDSYRLGGGSLAGAGFGGGGAGFNPGFLSAGSVGGFGFGGGNSSFSPINGGAIQRAALGNSTAFGGQGAAAVPLTGTNSAGTAGSQAGTSQPGTPWGRGLIGSATGHPVVFDSYRQVSGPR